MPSKTDIRELHRVLESANVAAALAAYLSRFKSRKSPSAHAARQKQKRLSRKEAVAAVRPLVVGRAGTFCECGCGRCFLATVGHNTPEWDEFHGRKHVTVEETWMLARWCHRNKTENYPTREWWDRTFAEHCMRHGYPFRPRLVKGEVVAQPPKERGVTNG